MFKLIQIILQLYSSKFRVTSNTWLHEIISHISVYMLNILFFQHIYRISDYVFANTRQKTKRYSGLITVEQKEKS